MPKVTLVESGTWYKLEWQNGALIDLFSKAPVLRFKRNGRKLIRKVKTHLDPCQFGFCWSLYLTNRPVGY